MPVALIAPMLMMILVEKWSFAIYPMLNRTLKSECPILTNCSNSHRVVRYDYEIVLIDHFLQSRCVWCYRWPNGSGANLLPWFRKNNNIREAFSAHKKKNRKRKENETKRKKKIM